MGTKTLDPAEAIKRFSKQDITVQTATPTRIKVKDADGKETGKERDGFKTKDEKLSVDHILAAAKRDNGTVVITTIDGQKYEAAGAGAAA